MPRRSAGRSAAVIVASSLAVALVAGMAVAAYAAVDLLAPVKPGVELAGEDVLEGAPDIGALEGGLNFLLVGSDERPLDGRFGDPDEESAILNDVNMLLHISQDHSHVEVVSFPRDMLVEVPGCVDPEDPEGEPLSSMSSAKINSVLSHGGLPCVALTIENLTGVTIPVGGVVKFDGVAALSEAVGGVEVCLTDPVEDPLSGFFREAGVHTLSGYDALAFLRTRHGIGDGSDLGRIAGQQAFMSSLARTLQSNDTLSDPVKLYSVAKAVLSNVELSNALQNPQYLMAIAATLRQVDLSKIAFVQYPTAYLSDFSAVEPSESAEEVDLALQQDRPMELDPDATTDASFGTDPGTPTAPVEPAPSATASPPAPSDAPAVAPPPSEVLPSDVTGTTGDQVRCARANEG